MTLKLIGKKIGMTRIFDEKGNIIVCTVISAQPNVVAQVKGKESDGYEAIELAAEEVTAPKVKNVSKALQGHFCQSWHYS